MGNIPWFAGVDKRVEVSRSLQTLTLLVRYYVFTGTALVNRYG